MQKTGTPSVAVPTPVADRTAAEPTVLAADRSRRDWWLSWAVTLRSSTDRPPEPAWPGGRRRVAQSAGYGRLMPSVASNSLENLLIASMILGGCSVRVAIIRSARFGL